MKKFLIITFLAIAVFTTTMAIEPTRAYVMDLQDDFELASQRFFAKHMDSYDWSPMNDLDKYEPGSPEFEEAARKIEANFDDLLNKEMSEGGLSYELDQIEKERSIITENQ